MNIHVGILTAAAALAFWCTQGVSGATYQWEYPLGKGCVVSDVVADGSGGAVICYYNTASNAAYVTYLDKTGAQVWHKTYTGFSAARSKHVTKKQVIVALAPSGGHSQLHEIDLKTGTDSLLFSSAGINYTVNENVVAPNKDAKGFFCVVSFVSGNPTQIMRYSYK